MLLYILPGIFAFTQNVFWLCPPPNNNYHDPKQNVVLKYSNKHLLTSRPASPGPPFTPGEPMGPEGPRAPEGPAMPAGPGSP